MCETMHMIDQILSEFLADNIVSQSYQARGAVAMETIFNDNDDDVAGGDLGLRNHVEHPE